jgi:hypothetical protein
MKKYRKQRCWDCQNARADKCCWFRENKPVKGWVSQIVSYPDENSTNGITYTYAIKECPNFVADETKSQKSDYLEKLAEELGVSVKTLCRRMTQKK